jgi:hypothetical protein
LGNSVIDDAISRDEARIEYSGVGSGEVYSAFVLLGHPCCAYEVEDLVFLCGSESEEGEVGGIERVWVERGGGGDVEVAGDGDVVQFAGELAAGCVAGGADERVEYSGEFIGEVTGGVVIYVDAGYVFAGC